MIAGHSCCTIVNCNKNEVFLWYCVYVRENVGDGDVDDYIVLIIKLVVQFIISKDKKNKIKKIMK